MRRTRCWTVASAAALLGLLIASPARAQRALPNRDVLVVLKQQAPLPAPAGGRRERVRSVVRALHATADAGQRSLVALLARRRHDRRVAHVRPFWIFNGLEVVADDGVIAELEARPEVAAVRAVTTLTAPPAPAGTAAAPAAEWNVARVNAPALWSRGLRGAGVVVASLDTGVDVSHPDLAGRWRGGTNSWYDPSGQHPTTPTDVSGHGTWTMGAMVGGDAGGTAIGVAPDARWIAAKIFNDRGVATTAGIHAAFQWLLDPDGDPATADAPNVVNGSWTMGGAGCNLEFQPDLRGLRAAGILPVFAAGNGGPAPGTGLSPADNPEAFAVGDTGPDDAIDASSSRGPSACGGAPFPALVAPGVDVNTSDLFGLYTTQSGTSLAAPHAAGALALLLGAFPGTDAARQAVALQQGAVDLGAAGPDDAYGAGRLDALGAYNWLATAPDHSVAATPASATAPAGGAVAYDIEVGALNGFAGDVALSLTGLTAAQATWSFAPATVTGGAGASRLTLTTSPALAPGTYPLTIHAASGGAVRTAGVTLVVAAPPGFTLAATPASAATPAGAGVSYTLTVAAQGGFTGDVALSLSGLSASQAAWTFSPATVTGGAGTSLLTVTPAAALAPGTYPLTLTATGATATRTAAVTLVVTAAPDFALAVTPASVTVVAGQSATYRVAVSAVGGFAGSVSLSATGLPSGASARFEPSTPAAPGVATLTVRTTRTTTRGTFTVKLSGRSGTLRRQATTALVVRR